MIPDRHERRRHSRCVKTVGMQCTRLNGTTQQVVTVRDFSRRGLYFESTWPLAPGTLVVLRSQDAAAASPEGPSRHPPFALADDDPEACMDYRSHTVASVTRCRELPGPGVRPLYGVGAEVQILTD